MMNSIPELRILKINLNDFLNFVAPQKELKEILLRSAELAKKRGEFLYFAGGVVRDYFYFQKINSFKKETIKDLDIVLQGNLEEFLKEFLQGIKGKIIFKSQFLTYKVKITLDSQEVFIDFITARKETYEDIARLPKVTPSNFKDDILRRDFTINTLIIGLSPPYEGYLIDLVKGLRDLEKGIIRPLYLDSFVDDPTRIFRGIRYKVRFDFEFSKEFKEALKRCFEKEALKKLTPARLSNELKLFLNKEPREKLKELLKVTKDLRILEKAGIKVNENIDLMVEILKEMEKRLNSKEKEKFFLLGLIDFRDLESAELLGFAKSEIEDLKKHFKRFEEHYKIWENLTLEEKIEFLEKLPVYFMLSLAVNFSKIKDDVLKYLKVYSKIKPELGGKDLKNLGIKEGKKIGEILRLLRFKKIKGDLKNKEDEIEFVKEFLLKK